MKKICYMAVLMFFCFSCFHRNLLYENEPPFVVEFDERIRLELINGNLIEGFIINEQEGFLLIYSYDYGKLLHSGIEAHYIFKGDYQLTGRLEKVNKDWIIIKLTRDGKEVRAKFKRNDLRAIKVPNMNYILTELHIRKEDIKSCEFLCAKEYFYSISHWLNLGDQVLISLRNDGEKRGVVRLITKKSLILRINKISEIDLKWHEIAKIQRIRISSKKLKAKSVIEIIAVFCMFYVIIRGITSINFGLE